MMGCLVINNSDGTFRIPVNGMCHKYLAGPETMVHINPSSRNLFFSFSPTKKKGKRERRRCILFIWTVKQTKKALMFSCSSVGARPREQDDVAPCVASDALLLFACLQSSDMM